VLIIVAGALSQAIDNFFSPASLADTARQAGEIGFVVLGMALVVIVGGIDLSVGSMFALCDFCALYFLDVHDWPVPAVILVTLLCGALLGAVNGLLIGYLRLRAFITTLITLIIYRSAYELLIQRYSNAIASAFPDIPSWDFIGGGSVFGIPSVAAISENGAETTFPRVSDQLAAWRSALARSLGNNGGVLIEVIPEIEFIVGPQPAPAVLGSTEAQNRFQRVLQSFVAALAQPEHPLVLFLDDLQWADAATLGLLEPLLAGAETRCLLLLGAYRENEPDAAPSLAPTLAALQASGVAQHRIALGPLPSGDLRALVADTLHWNAEEAEPLAKLIGQKTGGNPFFVTQFLRSLEREGHLRFDKVEARWICRIDEVASAPLADNVIELMMRSIQRLPSKSQYALTLAACIGNRFDRRTLAIVSEQTPAQIAADLAPALEEGLVVAAVPRGQPGATVQPDDDTIHAFLHDRVQQAAYALIPVDRRRMVHLTVGRLLRSRTPPDRLDAAHRFDILQHLNLGRALISNRVERTELAQLNLDAGQRAKASTAHDSALAVQILPTTILYDGQGKEVWRYVGDMDWTGAEAAKLLAEVG